MNCKQFLYSKDGLVVAYCTQERGTEHSHHDYSIEAMVTNNLAELVGVNCPHENVSPTKNGWFECDYCPRVFAGKDEWLEAKQE